MSKLIGLRLEQYTIQRQEVLMVEVKTAKGELETVAIYNGFSSSLTNPTPYNPDIPVIASDSKIVAIDRLVSPYNPNEPQYIERGLSVAEMEQLLETMKL
ncbi:hypothetical protein [Myxosarcina sp. GI1]|uniref:DUF7734 family protein n=1 Tax=Myxosarcina sp. GI1 TaxID=1541065 RepID=UPI0005669154|nr:hypothetical protein [Myxosarcina sp. GI1]